MAFSTQREFLNIHFRNEPQNLPERKPSVGQLKTYESCTDLRAWSLDKMLSSQYLLDLVHKARFRRPSQQTDGDYELSREYLLHLDVDVLVELVLGLIDELERVKSHVHPFNMDKQGIDERSAAVQQIAKAGDQERDQLIEQQSSVFAGSEQYAKELADLKEIIDNIRTKAEKHDVLVKENKCLREKLHALRKSNQSSWQKSRDSDCGDSVTQNCESLMAELCLFKNHYAEIEQQKRELMEQLQRSKFSERSVITLKNELYQEQLNREIIERQLADALFRNDRQASELYRKDNYIAMCNRRLEGFKSTPV
ncbi:uncharacterized protein LOC129765461 [Toxorhynchites rutilus septentrionalis]|uniref:uncharacterized protein LOC129765461 n=1 Tax=Toxorhynchites rutilus septentrionalis TaxID=329112 RepID=UPI002479C5CC|nr:uncharacterized protein LOC129765461 [Toxorhynchites rutilus septentrionalis]